MSRNTSERRDRILAAALQCFNEKGVEATGIGEICTRSGASIGSVYHHFGSKEGIAATLLAEGLRSNTHQLEERLERTRGAQPGIRAVVASLIDWIAAHPDWARFIYTVTHGSLNQAGGAELRTANDYHAQLIERHFGPHIKAGEFRRLPSECLASIVVGPVHDFARRWLGGQISGDIRDYINVFANTAWISVRNPRQA
ncbi:transcriptional regulator [Salinisphaera sp. PC39]|uniref:TetR/AcrR family transcriptional regulator n=1 Tax=Salinisphaera sp. PC39 TaxID=1304156 RepID=UPI00333F90E0